MTTTSPEQRESIEYYNDLYENIIVEKSINKQNPTEENNQPIIPDRFSKPQPKPLTQPKLQEEPPSNISPSCAASNEGYENLGNKASAAENELTASYLCPTERYEEMRPPDLIDCYDSTLNLKKKQDKTTSGFSLKKLKELFGKRENETPKCNSQPSRSPRNNALSFMKLWDKRNGSMRGTLTGPPSKYDLKGPPKPPRMSTEELSALEMANIFTDPPTDTPVSHDQMPGSHDQIPVSRDQTLTPDVHKVEHSASFARSNKTPMKIAVLPVNPSTTSPINACKFAFDEYELVNQGRSHKAPETLPKMAGNSLNTGRSSPNNQNTSKPVQSSQKFPATVSKTSVSTLAPKTLDNTPTPTVSKTSVGTPAPKTFYNTPTPKTLVSTPASKSASSAKTAVSNQNRVSFSELYAKPQTKPKPKVKTLTAVTETQLHRDVQPTAETHRGKDNIRDVLDETPSQEQLYENFSTLPRPKPLPGLKGTEKYYDNVEPEEPEETYTAATMSVDSLKRQMQMKLNF